MSRDLIEVEKNLVMTTPWTSEHEIGYSWTLASRLGLFLHEAEKRYGKRQTEWTLLGIEFCEGNDQSQIQYPFAEDKSMIVQLSAEAAKNEILALSQLAYECVHLLAPVGKMEKVSVLEEGLAILFSEDSAVYGYASHEHFGSDGIGKEAAGLVKILLEIDGEGIKKLRAKEGYFYKMTQDTFQEADLSVPPDLVNALLADYEDLKVKK